MIKILCILFLMCQSILFANMNIAEVCIGMNCWQMRIADTPQLRSKGLMFENSMPIEQGMIFYFENERFPQFWMKDMQFPLDILFVNKDNIITYMVKYVPPCRKEPCDLYRSTRKADKVIEINAGLSDKLNIHVGDSVLIKRSKTSG